MKFSILFSGKLLVAVAAGVFLGADWGAAVAATADGSGAGLSRAAELALAAVFAAAGGIAGSWFARARHGTTGSRNDET